MGFDQYRLYSVLSTTKGKNRSDVMKIFDKLTQFNNYHDSAKVKQFLEETYGVVGDVKRLAIDTNCFLTTTDEDDYFIVELDFMNKNIVHCYRKNIERSN